MTTDSATGTEACFAAIERAALAGQRCPENGSFGVDSIYTTALAKAGRIKVEISGHNYRTVTILTGPNAGKRTKPNPTGRKPWKIIDSNGTRRAGGFVAQPRTAVDRQPSMPRLLGDTQ